MISGICEAWIPFGADDVAIGAAAGASAMLIGLLVKEVSPIMGDLHRIGRLGCCSGVLYPKS